MSYALRSTLALGSLLLVTQSGCLTLTGLLGAKKESLYDTSLLKAQGFSVPPGGMPSPLPDSLTVDANSIVVEVRNPEPHLTAITLPSDRAVTVEDLAQRMRWSDQLGACNVYIMRPNGAQPPVRLDLQLSSKGQSSSPVTNYALHARDHIIVVGGGSSTLERFLDRQLGVQ
ncbi:MAG: hypothetical protein KF752_18500 [Pirellulaceae bacterium]|nr:hypothetical protein [Pirellulaceae bacterium]